MEFIDLKQQYQNYKTQIDSAWKKVMAHGQFIMGPEVQELERQLATFTNSNYCISVANGTDALQLALMALDIGPGDEVITTSYTWLSSAETIAILGATPVLVDINPETFLIDIEQTKQAITRKTKAIIPVSLFGQLPNIPQLLELDIPIIEDGAQSLGAKQNGVSSCSWATLSTTSFFPAKPLGCYGDGGAVFTQNESLAEKISSLRLHGGNRNKGFHYPYIGLNSRLDTLQAAILLEKLPYFSAEIEKRQQIGRYYTENLKKICHTPKIEDGNTHLYAQYVIRIADRDLVKEKLKEQGIPTAIYYPKAIHQQPAYSNALWDTLPHSEQATLDNLALPMHPWLTQSEQDQIITALKKIKASTMALT